MFRIAIFLLMTLVLPNSVFAADIKIPSDLLIEHLPVLPFQSLVVRDAPIRSEEMLLPADEAAGIVTLNKAVHGVSASSLVSGVVLLETDRIKGAAEGILVSVNESIVDGPLYDTLDTLLTSASQPDRSLQLEARGLIGRSHLNRSDVCIGAGDYTLASLLVEVMKQQPRLSFDVLFDSGSAQASLIRVGLNFQGNLVSEGPIDTYSRRAEWVGVPPGRDPAEMLLASSAKDRALGLRLLQQHPEGSVVLGRLLRSTTDPAKKITLIPAFRRIIAGPVKNPELDAELVEAVTSVKESADVEALVEASYFLAYRKSARATEVTDMVLDECVRRGVQPSAKLQRASDLSRAPRQASTKSPTPESLEFKEGPRQ